MFCTKCGKEMPDGSKFCTGCGAQLGSGQVSGVQMNGQRAASGGQQAAGVRKTSSSSGKKRGFLGSCKTVLHEIWPVLKNPIWRTWAIAKKEHTTKAYGLLIFHLVGMFVYTLILLVGLRSQLESSFLGYYV